MNLNFTLPSVEQIRKLKSGELLDRYGTTTPPEDIHPLEVLAKYGTRLAPTDLAKLLGAQIEESGYLASYRNPDGELVGDYWTTDSYDGYDVHLCDVINFGKTHSAPTCRQFSIRPMLSASETSKIQPTNTKQSDGITIHEYGEYPQSLAPENVSHALETQFKRKNLKTTGKKYTFDQHGLDQTEGFHPHAHTEYEYEDKKYIRVQGHSRQGMSPQHDCKLSDKHHIEDKPYWIEVQPIEWLTDPSGIWIAKKGLLSGIQFDTGKSYNGNFKHTFLQHYLNTYFAKEIEPSHLQENRDYRKTILPPNNSDTLALKANEIEEKVAKIRALREKAIKAVQMAGSSLTKDQIMEMRQKEEAIRLQVATQFLQQKKGKRI